MKNRSIFLTIMVLLSSIGFSQVLKPVKWTFSSAKTSDSTANLYCKATIDKGWHVYSQFIKADGPVPTTFAFEKSTDFKLVGNPVEPKGIEEFDPNFEMKLKFFENTVTFIQQIKIASTKAFKVKGSLNFMTCDNKQCLPPEDVDFLFNVDGYIKAKAEKIKEKDTAAVDSKTAKTVQLKDTTAAVIKPANKSEKSADTSLWMVFFFSLLPGFIAIFTPCVFPMVPMTVSFFLKGSENRRRALFQSIFYGVSIILISTVPIALLIGISFMFGKGAVAADFFNWLSTHWIPNISFFIIFMIFAASFFGMFEIVLPSKLVNKMDAKVDNGGFFGPFFMAFVLVLVSFSCTGPIVGAVVVESSAGGNIWHPIIAMLGFSFAFALPFAVFAYFPSWLSNLPKSGGWLNSVKVSLGFIELALGLKFLSVADQTYHWRILDREVYLAMWIVIFFLMGVYLLGKLKFAHDCDMHFLKFPRFLLAVIVFSFVVYMIPGMFGAPLKMLSGWLPPQTTQDFDIKAIVRDEIGNASFSGGNKGDTDELCDKPKFSDFLDMPHGLKGYFDYDQALACSKQNNKPIFLDFTGHGCVNCRKMEENVWSDPRALKLLKEKFIICVLYVDDKKELPEAEWITSKYDGQVKKTIGKKCADFEISRFNINAQPYSMLLDNKGDTLGKPIGYKSDPDIFISFLENGLKEFTNRQNVKK